LLVVEDRQAVVNALDSQRVERGGDVVWPGVLAGVRGQAQTSSACDPERGCEVARVDATLGRIHPQPDHPIRLTCSPKLGQALGELQSSLAAVRAVDVADQHA